MPGLVETTSWDPNQGREREDALRKDFRQITAGWVCNECGALAPYTSDAETHLEWHAKLNG